MTSPAVRQVSRSAQAADTPLALSCSVHAGYNSQPSAFLTARSMPFDLVRELAVPAHSKMMTSPRRSGVCWQVKEGDNILYFKWAGDQMETTEGKKFVVLHESDILCKV